MMKYKVSKLNFDTASGKLIYIDLEGGICNEQKRRSGDFGGFIIAQDYIYTMDRSKGITYKLNVDLEVVESIPVPISFLPNSKDPGILTGIQNVNNVKNWVLVNSKTFDVLETFPITIGGNGIAMLLNRELFIGKSINSVYQILFDGERIQWSYNFNDLLGKEATLVSELLLHKQTLFFNLVNSENQATSIACIDQESGKLISVLNGGGWLKIFDGKIFTANKKVIQIIDAVSLERSSLDVSDQLPFFNGILGMSYRNFVVEGDLFFFAGERTSDVGAIRLSDKKLIWHIHVDVESENNPLIREIKADRKRLYVLDHANTLHVFERDEIM